MRITVSWFLRFRINLIVFWPKIIEFFKTIEIWKFWWTIQKFEQLFTKPVSAWLLVKTVVLDLKLRVKKITRVKNKMVTVNNVYSLAIMQKLSYWWGGFHTWILGILVSYNFFIFSYSINFLKNTSMLLLFNFPYFSIVFSLGKVAYQPAGLPIP